VAIKIGKSRETGTYGYIRHKTRTNKTKHTTQYVWDTTTRKQTQITWTRHESSYKQPEVKTNRTSFLCGNRNGTQNVKTHNRTIQKTKKMSNTEPTK